MKIWTNDDINHYLQYSDTILVFGSNPEGRHGRGAALLAYRKWGAVQGQGRGLQGRSYGLVTKNLRKGYTEPATGITYHKAGRRSVEPIDILGNIVELYNVADTRPDLKFLVIYTFDEGSNFLSGYTSKELAELFLIPDLPENVYFHNTIKLHAK